jgi:Protein of unknown function (DUF1579)
MATKKMKASAGKAKLTTQHRALHDFVGKWKMQQKVWMTPDSEPLINRGHSTCTAILDGVATLMLTEMDNTAYKGMALMSYNVKQGRYDLAWTDTVSGEGICFMEGVALRSGSNPRLREEFGSRTTEVRQWHAVIAACLPDEALNSVSRFSSTANSSSANGQPEMSMRLVENRVNDNTWVLEFFTVGRDKKEFLFQQNLFTR